MEELLKNYKNYQAEIQIKKHMINSIQNSTYDCSTTNLSGLPGKTGYKDCALESFVVNKDNQVYKLEKSIKALTLKLQMIDSLIDTLKEKSKTIVKMYYIHGYTEPEIANELQLQISGVQKSKKKSILKMQEIYNKKRV